MSIRCGIEIDSILRLLLPEAGCLAMLSCYFDDSGTHGSSEIAVIAGVVGTDWQYRELDARWKALLADPLCGYKPPISRFHMFDCFNSTGDFKGWKREETDFCATQFRRAIIESKLYAYGVAVSVKDWNELVHGDLRSIHGRNAEGFALRQCFVGTIACAQANYLEKEMVFVFEDRPNVNEDVSKVYSAFKANAEAPPELSGLAFLDAASVRPLQAADVVAWELYNFALGGIKKLINPRPAMRELLEVGLDLNKILNRDAIVEMLVLYKDYDPNLLKHMAQYFN